MDLSKFVFFRWGLVIFVLAVSIALCGSLNAAVLQTNKVMAAVNSAESQVRLKSISFKKTFLDGYRTDRNYVKKGQTLSMILKPYRVSASSIFKLCKMANGIFDIRQIKAGRPYYIVLDPEQRLEVKYFIYETTPVEFVVFELGKSPGVFIGQKQLEKKTRVVSGTISSSLWRAMKDQDVSIELALKIKVLLGSRINFRKLVKKNSYDIIFEEYSDGERVVKTGEVLLIALQSGDTNFTAYRYKHHGILGLYDENGNNLQTAFLSSPLKYKKVTSKFSSERRHPITKKIKSHPAIDYGAPKGTPVMSIGDGVVETVGYSSTAGNNIKINHLDSFDSNYLHLDAIADGLGNGFKVKKGDVIGFVGSTGFATGPHLDFRFSKKGRLIDYLSAELPGGLPIDEVCKDDFLLSIQQMLNKTKKRRPSDVDTT